MNYQEMLQQINAKADEVAAMFNVADARSNGDVTADEKARIIALNKEIAELESRAADTREFNAVRAASDDRQRTSRLVAPGAGLAHAAAPGAEGQHRAARQTLGSLFVGSAEWRDYLARIAPDGRVSENQAITSPKLLLPWSVKATLVTGDSVTSGGAFMTPDQSGIYDPLGRAPLTLRDIISVRPTSSDSIDYVRQTSRTNNAATVAEATATAGASGAKPESAMAFARVNVSVETIANWVPATKRALADGGQLRGIIDQELRDNLNEELEDQILNGNGTTPNLTGLDSVSGTQDQAFSTDLLETYRKARTLVRTVGRAIPTAYVMNPSDWETVDLLQDNEARYFFGGPSQLGTPRLWGLPVVESEAQAAGNAWVGDWRKLVLWDREQAMISVSDSHADFFVRNLVAILAELRAAVGVIRPSAFVEIALS